MDISICYWKLFIIFIVLHEANSRTQKMTDTDCPRARCKDGRCPKKSYDRCPEQDCKNFGLYRRCEGSLACLPINRTCPGKPCNSEEDTCADGTCVKVGHLCEDGSVRSCYKFFLILLIYALPIFCLVVCSIVGRCKDKIMSQYNIMSFKRRHQIRQRDFRFKSDKPTNSDDRTSHGNSKKSPSDKPPNKLPNAELSTVVDLAPSHEDLTFNVPSRSPSEMPPARDDLTADESMEWDSGMTLTDLSDDDFSVDLPSGSNSEMPPAYDDLNTDLSTGSPSEMPHIVTSISLSDLNSLNVPPSYAEAVSHPELYRMVQQDDLLTCSCEYFV